MPHQWLPYDIQMMSLSESFMWHPPGQETNTAAITQCTDGIFIAYTYLTVTTSGNVMCWLLSRWYLSLNIYVVDWYYIMLMYVYGIGNHKYIIDIECCVVLYYSMCYMLMWIAYEWHNNTVVFDIYYYIIVLKMRTP